MLNPYINKHTVPHQIDERTASCLDKDIYLWIDPSLDPEKDIDLVCLSNGMEIINHDGTMPLKKGSSQQITKGYIHQQAATISDQKVKFGKVRKGIFNKQYTSNAVVPRMSWQPIVHVDFLNNLLVGEGCPSYYNTVAIVKLSTKIEDFMSSVNFSEININSCLNHDFINEIVSSISVEVEKLNTCGYQVFNSIAINKPGLRTVTFDHEQSKYLGLHLDSFDKGYLSERRFSSNRICMNLSSEDRYFVFINKTLITIAKEIKQRQPELIPEETHLDISRLAYYFAICKPHYPVVKVKCPPGYAYIAPTENIIHDGSSENQTQLDVSISFRGFFSPNPRQVINDSQYGDLDLLTVHSLLTDDECQNLIQSPDLLLTHQTDWRQKINNRLQHLFDNDESGFSHNINVSVANQINLHKYQQSFHSQLIENSACLISSSYSSRYRLVIFLNHDFIGGEINMISSDHQFSPKQGTGIIISQAHKYTQNETLQGTKMILEVDLSFSLSKR